MFISFEGIDLSGKSTQLSLVQNWLDELGQESLLVREPGGTDISERIRDMLLDHRNRDMDPVAEMLLFSAARAQLVSQVINPALRRGVHVLADRFFDSTLAYQGYGRGLDIDALTHVQQFATGGLSPELTLYFDLDFEETERRRATRSQDNDRIEASDRDFFERVRLGYHLLARHYSQRFVIIDASGNIEAVFSRVSETIRARM
jgi:dTMP kinase